MGFTTFGLSPQVLKGVHEAGYKVPTPIQKLAIGPAVEGRDVIGCAQTGTGKTAAFVLPMLHRLEAEKGLHHRNPRALVLTPTRELCQQVKEAVSTYGKFMSLRAVSVYGGVSMVNQVKLLHRGADIVVATPGRLLDHMQRATIDLSGIRVLVLDEADRMLDMGFIHDVKKIIAKVPRDRQTMLFSATLSSEINTLASSVLRDPVTVEDGARRNPVETIEQHFYHARKEEKTDLLCHALSAENMVSVLVFSRTKHGADKICRRLESKNISAIAIHSNRSQSQRDRALEGFKRGTYRVLVATDIAARGIDVDGISHVVNYDIPHEAEDYIHRIGRTGRAGASGDAVTFVDREDVSFLRRIEQYVGKKIPVKDYPGFTPSARPASHVAAAAARPHQSSPPRHPRNQPGAATRKQRFIEAPRKKKGPPKRMDSFSSDAGGSAWSNH